MTDLIDIFQGHHEHPALFQERSVLEYQQPQHLREFIEDIHRQQEHLAGSKLWLLMCLVGMGKKCNENN